ncbi:retrovirus-related pol polyprotein from transposon TNT 1-94 [Tanacetum coccineum]
MLPWLLIPIEGLRKPRSGGLGESNHMKAILVRESREMEDELVILGKDNGENIMKSIKEGPFHMGTVSDVIAGGTEGAVQQGPVRARVLNDLSAKEKERYKADIRATNILLQGIPKDIYSLINHYTDAKDIWENVKMILEGSELTKDDRESQLYDEFEHFRQNKGETIQGYYVRFTKLINDMRNIKMTMPRMQLNSKFVNNMLPEWSRFITEVKLNRGLKESNFDQLYAYLKQHEVHANENRIMMERFIQPNNDPLALVSDASVQQYPTQSSKSPQPSKEPSPADNFQLDSGSSSTENLIESLSNTLALLTQSYKSHLPQTNNQLRASSNARNKAMVQDGKVVVQDVRGRYNATNQGRPFQRNNARGNGVAGNVGAQNRGGMINHAGQIQDSDYFKDKMLLMQAQESGAVLDEEQSLFLAGEQVTNVDDDVDDSTENDLALNVDHIFEADECDAFDSDVDGVGPTSTDHVHANLTSERSNLHEARDIICLDFHLSNIIPYDQYVKDNEEHVVQCNASSVRNDALMSILDEMHEHGVQSRLANKTDMVMNDSVTSKLARYKELVGEYEKRTKFKLTDRERKIDEQMRIIISDQNRKETSLKSELHSAQILLSSTVDHYKSKAKEVTLLKKDFKQKEDKFLEEFFGHKQCAEIEKKNLLIENENLIVNCLSTQLLYEVEKSRCLDLEADMSKVHDEFNERDNKAPSTPVPRKKQVTFSDKPETSSSNTQKHKVHQRVQLTNIPVLPSIGVNDSTEESWSKPRSNTKKNRILPAKKENKKEVESLLPIRLACSKASKSKSWLWHRRLNHLNFGTINDLARKDLVRGLPRLKFEKDHLCSACQLGKSKKFSHRPKSENTNMEVLHTLHMDLCGPMRVQSIKGKKYILVIVDDYSRFTWVKFLRSKDETPEFVTNFLKQIQVGLNKTVRFIRTDNGTEFVNQVMSEYYEGVGIFHQKSVPRTPQQNGVVERRNRTLVEAARTMMIFSKAPMFLWAEAVATACYTQNRSLIHTRHNKTPYELVHDKKPDLTFFRVFGALCYPANDSENLGKFQAKADIGIFVGYAPSRKGYRIYNKRTRRLMETIHVTFDEMHQSMAPARISSGPAPFIMTPG